MANHLNIAEKVKQLLEPKQVSINARLFVTRDDGITIYDSVQNQTTTSVAALVSGVWQASEALMGLVNKDSDVLEFRMGFDTASQGIFLVPLQISGKRYFLGAIYTGQMNPGQLKRRVAMLKEEFALAFATSVMVKPRMLRASREAREGFLFKDISDEEIDRLFAPGGV
jgi:hypothetical protein